MKTGLVRPKLRRSRAARVVGHACTSSRGSRSGVQPMNRPEREPKRGEFDDFQEMTWKTPSDAYRSRDRIPEPRALVVATLVFVILICSFVLPHTGRRRAAWDVLVRRRGAPSREAIALPSRVFSVADPWSSASVSRSWRCSPGAGRLAWIALAGFRVGQCPVGIAGGVVASDRRRTGHPGPGFGLDHRVDRGHSVGISLGAGWCGRAPIGAAGRRRGAPAEGCQAPTEPGATGNAR